MTLEETVEREKHNSIVKVRTIRLYALKEQKITQMKTQIVKTSTHFVSDVSTVLFH